MTHVRGLLGESPAIRKSTGFRIYWIYRQLGIECLFSIRSERLLSLFFFSAGVDGHIRGARVRTDRGLTFGDSKARVLRVYGKPDLAGGGFTMSDGKYVREWHSYHTGLAFGFGTSKQIEQISIFRKRRVAKALASSVRTG